MSLGLKYKNNEQIFVERQRGGVPVSVLSAFGKYRNRQPRIFYQTGWSQYRVLQFYEHQPDKRR